MGLGEMAWLSLLSDGAVLFYSASSYIYPWVGMGEIRTVLRFGHIILDSGRFLYCKSRRVIKQVICNDLALHRQFRVITSSRNAKAEPPIG